MGQHPQASPVSCQGRALCLWWLGGCTGRSGGAVWTKAVITLPEKPARLGTHTWGPGGMLELCFNFLCSL